MVGIARFNTKYSNYQRGEFRSHVATFAHEVMHAIFFHPTLFRYYFPDSNGQSFLFQDSNGFYKIRGQHILQQIRDHFNCPSIDGGTHASHFNLQRLWKMGEAQAPLEAISRNWCSAMK